MRHLWRWALVTLFFIMLAPFSSNEVDVGWLVLSAFFGYVGVMLWLDLDEIRKADEESER